MEIRIAGTVEESIVDGPGFRFTVFTQGCPHHCPGCHNPQTHDFAGGRLVDCQTLLDKMGEDPLLDGLTLSGGDPFEQCAPCAFLAKGAKALGLNVWVYSGYTFEQILADPQKMELLQACDVLVDGPFLLAQRTLEARFRGSRNQRLIQIAPSLAAGRPVLLDLT